MPSSLYILQPWWEQCYPLVRLHLESISGENIQTPHVFMYHVENGNKSFCTPILILLSFCQKQKMVPLKHQPSHRSHQRSLRQDLVQKNFDDDNVEITELFYTSFFKIVEVNACTLVGDGTRLNRHNSTLFLNKLRKNRFTFILLMGTSLI